MNRQNPGLLTLPLWWICVAVLAAAAVGCRREEVQVYQVEKEKSAGPPAAVSPHGANPHGAMGAIPKLNWKVPAGWTEQPASGMRAASFAIKGPENQTADVAVIPLAGITGRDLEMVNMWRAQLQLDAIKAEELDPMTLKAQVGPAVGKLFDMTSKQPLEGQKQPWRVLAAMLEREGTGWFFKMSGPNELLEEQKPAFLEFLKSIEFQAAAQTPSDGMSMGNLMSATPTSATDGEAKPDRPNWSVPVGWQETSGGQFLAAKFNIAGESGAQASVNVSVSAGEGGGWAGNVNRWRGQLGLSALSPDEIGKATTALAAGESKAMLVEMAGTDARTSKPAKVVGVMVPRAGQVWFYKLMGDPKVVESQTETFTKFIESVKY